jgi:hypothetical protein
MTLRFKLAQCVRGCAVYSIYYRERSNWSERQNALNHLNMNGILFFLALLFALTSLSCNKEIDNPSSVNTTVQASNVVTRQTYDFDYNMDSQLYSLCSPEMIRINGTGHVNVKYMFRDNAYHALITSRISNAKGVGSVSGKIYTVTARSHEVIVRRSLNGPREIENYKERYVIKGEGEQTYIAVGNLTWKVNEDGVVSRLKTEFSLECK